MTYLDNGKYAAPSDELTALVLEAHRGEKARRKKRR